MDVDQYVLRTARSCWNKRVVKFAKQYLRIWQDYAQLAVQLADQLAVPVIQACKYGHTQLIKHHLDRLQCDKRMVELLELVFNVWWHYNSQACRANIPVVTKLVLQGLAANKMHFVDLLYLMFDLVDHEAFWSDLGCDYDDCDYNVQVCQLVSHDTSLLVKLASKCQPNSARRTMLCDMLQAIVQLGMVNQDMLPRMVADILVDPNPMWQLLIWMDEQPGFWPAFLACQGPAIAARDFMLGNNPALDEFLEQQVVCDRMDDQSWQVFGVVLRDRLGGLLGSKTVRALLGCSVVRQAFVDCDGLVKLAWLMDKMTKLDRCCATQRQLKKLCKHIAPTGQDKHYPVFISSFRRMMSVKPDDQTGVAEK